MRDQLDSSDSIGYIAVADEIRRRLGAVRGGREFDSWIRRATEELRPTQEGRQVIEAVRRLGPVIMTTNLDALIEDLEPRWSSYTWTDDEYSSAFRSDNVVLHLRGVASNPQSVIFSSADYERPGRDNFTQVLDSALFVSYKFIFIGYGNSFDDPDTTLLVDFLNRSPSTASVEHYLLVRGGQLRQFIERPLSAMITPVAYGADLNDLIPFLQKLASREEIDVSQDPDDYEQLVTDSSLSANQVGLADLIAAREVSRLRELAANRDGAAARYRAAEQAGDIATMRNIRRMQRAAARTARAEATFRHAVRKGDTSAMRELGRLLEAEGNTSEAEEMYHQAVDAGDASAKRYLNATGLRPKCVEAGSCFRDAG